jgi:hypothetical protein
MRRRSHKTGKAVELLEKGNYRGAIVMDFSNDALEYAWGYITEGGLPGRMEPQ